MFWLFFPKGSFTEDKSEGDEESFCWCSKRKDKSWISYDGWLMGKINDDERDEFDADRWKSLIIDALGMVETSVDWLKKRQEDEEVMEFVFSPKKDIDDKFSCVREKEKEKRKNSNECSRTHRLTAVCMYVYVCVCPVDDEMWMWWLMLTCSTPLPLSLYMRLVDRNREREREGERE